MLRSAYTSTTAILGSITSAIALFNFAAQYFEIGLFGIVADFIAYYQELFFPAIDFLKSHVPWMIPDWNKNIVVLVASVVAIHARSTAQHFVRKFADEATSDRVIGEGSRVAQISVGLRIALAHFAGAASIGGAGRHLSTLSASTITAFVFLLFVSLGIFTPYIRNLVVVFLAVSVVLFISSLWSKNTSVIFLNRRVFALHYLGAIVGAAVIFALNGYSS